MNRKLLSLLLVLILSLAHVSLMAQRERNYIYILDCSNSMIAPIPPEKPIWNETLDFLKNDIEQLTTQSQVSLILFQGKPEQPISFIRKDYDQGYWDNKIAAPANVLVQKLTGTNIVDSWKAGVGQIDPLRDNYLYLLTDGQPNKGGDIDAVCRVIEEWCGKYANTYGFYVMLRDEAKDDKLTRILRRCPQIQIIDDHTGPFGCIVYENEDLPIIYVNTLELPKSKKLIYSAMGQFDVNVVSENSYFDVILKNNVIEKGEFELEIRAKKSIKEINEELDSTYQFSVQLVSKDTKVLNPDILIEVINKLERLLTMPDFSEIEIEEISHYHSYLFWPMEPLVRRPIDLGFVFNEEAKKDGSFIELKFEEKNINGENEPKKGFTLYKNDEPLKNNTLRLSANEEMPKLEIEYADDAEDGKRYIQVFLTKINEIDRMGNSNVYTGDVVLTLRSEYGTRWNPLKWILLVLGIVIAAIVIFISTFFRMQYHVIRYRVTMITDSSSKSISSQSQRNRKIVLTSKKKSQNIFSRCFKGKIKYVQTPFCTNDIELTAAKNGVRCSARGYDIDPAAAILRRDIDNNEYVFKRKDDSSESITLRIG